MTALYADDRYNKSLLGLTDSEEVRATADLSWAVSENASLYLMAPGYERSPVHEVTGSDAEGVESDVRDWIDCYFPK